MRNIDLTEAVEAVRRVAEVDHKYSVAPSPAFADKDAVSERRLCACGVPFLTAVSHKQHVYECAVRATLPYLRDQIVEVVKRSAE